MKKPYEPVLPKFFFATIFSATVVFASQDVKFQNPLVIE